MFGLSNIHVHALHAVLQFIYAFAEPELIDDRHPKIGDPTISSAYIHEASTTKQKREFVFLILFAAFPHTWLITSNKIKLRQ